MPKSADGWRFEWARTWTDVWDPSFVGRWQQTYEADPARHVYQRPALARAWADTIGAAREAQPLVGVARAPAGATVLLPWVVVRRNGRIAARRTIESLGGDLFGYQNPLVAGADPREINWPAFWAAARLETGGHGDQGLIRLLQPPFANGVAGRLPSEESPIIDLQGCASLDDVLRRCRSSHRVDVKRQRRRLADAGAVSFWVAQPGDEARARCSLHDGLLPAYRAVWAHRPDQSGLLRPGLESFLERVVDAGVRDGWTHYSVLAIDATPIAWHLGFVDRGRMYFWLPTYDIAWSNYSPGKVLLSTMLDQACRTGWTEFHLLTGAHEYKLAWNPRLQRLAAVAWKAPTVRGRLLGWYDALRRAS